MTKNNGEFRELAEDLRDLGRLAFRNVLNPDAGVAAKLEGVRRKYHDVFGKDLARRARFIEYINGEGIGMNDQDRVAMRKDSDLIYRGISYVQESPALELAG